MTRDHGKTAFNMMRALKEWQAKANFKIGNE